MIAGRIGPPLLAETLPLVVLTISDCMHVPVRLLVSDKPLYPIPTESQYEAVVSSCKAASLVVDSYSVGARVLNGKTFGRGRGVEVLVR